MFRLQRLRMPVLIIASLSAIMLAACGPSETPKATEADQERRSASFTSIGQSSYSGGSTPAEKATKEHLESLPKAERIRAELEIERRELNRLRLNSKEQVIQWIEWARPKCEDFFGSDACVPMAMELERWNVCDWRPIKRIQSENDLDAEGHYFVILFDPRTSIPTGGYIWVASYGYQVHPNEPTLNAAEELQSCWIANQATMPAMEQ